MCDEVTVLTHCYARFEKVADTFLEENIIQPEQNCKFQISHPPHLSPPTTQSLSVQEYSKTMQRNVAKEKTMTSPADVEDANRVLCEEADGDRSQETDIDQLTAIEPEVFHIDCASL